MAYAVEVITYINRGSRNERQIATGQYAYYATRDEAERVARRDDTNVIPCAYADELDGGL